MMYHKPGIDLRGVKPQTFWAMQQMNEEYAAHGYDCWWTSAFRSDPESLHGYGLAGDGDAPVDLPHHIGARIAAGLRQRLGDQYDVIYHKGSSGRWHHHIEFDPTGEGVKPHKEDGNGHEL